LQRTSHRELRDAELVAGVSAQRVVLHELVRDSPREVLAQSPSHVNPHELAVLAGIVGRELSALAREIRLLAVGLRPHGYVLAGGHRHRAGDGAGDAGGQQAHLARIGGRDADQQARRRDDAVVGAEHGGAQPARADRAMPFSMSPGHARAVYRLAPASSARAEPIVMTMTNQRTNRAPRSTAKCTAVQAPSAWPAPSSKPRVQST
jgi:hypothetical protein